MTNKLLHAMSYIQLTTRGLSLMLSETIREVDGSIPAEELLPYVATELERLSIEANHLAQECTPEMEGPIPGFDT